MSALKQATSTKKNCKKIKLYQHINILNWNYLNREQKLTEQNFAAADIIKFANSYIPKSIKPSLSDASFQTYLAPHIWARMSAQERKLHLQKRDAFIKKGIRITRPKFKKIQKVYFFNKNRRPLLLILSRRGRHQYLKALVMRAREYSKSVHRESGVILATKQPAAKISISKLHTLVFKSVIQKITKNKSCLVKSVNLLLPKR